MNRRRIYLDNAATSWPKPPAVIEAVQQYMLQNGAAAGRGLYQEALAVERSISCTRSAIANLIHAPSADSVVFTFNGTDSLNLALQGALRTGQRVLTTSAEHNSVLRPLEHLRRTRAIAVEFVNCDAEGMPDYDDFQARIVRCDWLVVNHASNVTGGVLPLASWVKMARQNGVQVLVDAAQTIGCTSLDVQQLDIQLLAASGHKGLLGPLGTGFLYIQPNLQRDLVPLRFGGTGSRSSEETQPDLMPDRFEAGNLNVPGIVGLGEGLRYVVEQGIASLDRHEQQLREQCLAGLERIKAIRVLAAKTAEAHTGVLSFLIEGFDPQEAAAVLAESFNIQVRAGLHCAPRMHRALGTEPAGTIRVSFGPFNTPDDVEQLLLAVSELSNV